MVSKAWMHFFLSRCCPDIAHANDLGMDRFPILLLVSDFAVPGRKVAGCPLEDFGPPQACVSLTCFRVLELDMTTPSTIGTPVPRWTSSSRCISCRITASPFLNRSKSRRSAAMSFLPLLSSALFSGGINFLPSSTTLDPRFSLRLQKPEHRS